MKTKEIKIKLNPLNCLLAPATMFDQQEQTDAKMAFGRSPARCNVKNNK